MFTYVITFAILLSLKPALGSSDEMKVVASHIYEDEELNKIQHQIQLLSTAHENLRLRMEANNERIDRRLTEISNEINSHLIRISNETNTRLGGLANEIIRKLAEDTNLVYEKNKKDAYPASCLKLAGGLHQIQINRFSSDPFFVYCDNVTQGGGWTVIQRRMDGSVDFFRNWADYKHGFGNLEQEFFIGLDKLHVLTMTSENELLIVMRDKDGIERFAKYESFAIGDENQYYALRVLGKYSGDAGDDLSLQLSGRFCTKDNDGPNNCAMRYTGAWWETDDACRSSLNGKYGDDTVGKGINWYEFHGFEYSLPYVQMMIRPKTQ